MEDFPARTRYQNQEEAELYDARRTGKYLHRIELAAFARAVASMPREYRVLDVPCGTGRLWAPLLERFASVTGCDISQDMLNVCERHHSASGKVTLKQGDAVALPFADNEFDCVFSVRFWGYPPPEVRIKALKEMARVSKDRVALMFYVRDPAITARKKVQFLLRPPKGPWYPVDSKRELYRLFAEAGLEIESYTSLMPFLMESRMVIAKKVRP